MAKTFKQFRLDNVTATLPTTLEYGEEVYYTDANGNLTLWVGHSDGSAWPVCGYKEWVGIINQTGTSAPTADVLFNTFGTVTPTRSDVGVYAFSYASVSPNTPVCFISDAVAGEATFIIKAEPATTSVAVYTYDGATPSDSIVGTSNTTLVIRIYP